MNESAHRRLMCPLTFIHKSDPTHPYACATTYSSSTPFRWRVWTSRVALMNECERTHESTTYSSSTLFPSSSTPFPTHPYACATTYSSSTPFQVSHDSSICVHECVCAWERVSMSVSESVWAHVRAWVRRRPRGYEWVSGCKRSSKEAPWNIKRRIYTIQWEHARAHQMRVIHATWDELIQEKRRLYT